MDDEKALRDEIVDRLELEGFDVLEASNGQQALDVLDTHRPALIISDVAMPLLDGFDLTRTIREKRGLDIPIIILTAHGDAETKQKAASVNATVCMEKPFEFAVLVATIRQHLAATT